MQNANLNNFDANARHAIREFEKWQMKVFAKNAKKGWRFFQPDTLHKPTPRSAKEAWGDAYKTDRTEKYEKRNERIMFAVIVLIMLILATI